MLFELRVKYPKMSIALAKFGVEDFLTSHSPE